MGLFTKMQMEKINAAAKKSQQLAEPKRSVSSKSINTELNQISQSVTDYFKDSKAELITTVEQLHDYVTKMIQFGIGGIDTETTGLDRLKDHIVGFSLYFPDDVEVYIPCKHIVPIFDEPYANQLSYEDVGKELHRFVESKTRLVFANADFDLAMIFKDFKVDLIENCYYDVIIAWRCLKENERDNSLKGLYNKYPLKGKGDPMKFRDFFSPTLFPYCKPEVAKLYAANDAKITYELFLWQLPYLTKDHPKCKKHNFEAIADLVWGVEFPMIAVCQRMHRRGIYLEQSVGEMLKRKYLPQCDEEHKKLRQMVQELIDDPKYTASAKPPFSSSSDFNPNSVPHVKWLCYDLLKLDGGKKGGTGKEILSTFNLPVTKQILKCRSLVTLIGTFVEKLPNSTSSDSRIHCQFKQMGADCVVGNTIVATDVGYRKISDICIPAEMSIGNHVDVAGIRVFNCNQELEDVKSVIAFKQYPTIKITTQYGFTIEGTYNHPVMVSKSTHEDYLRNRSEKAIHTFWEGRYFKRLDELNVGDIIEIPCNYQHNGLYQPTLFPEVDTLNSKKSLVCPDTYTEDFAEFLGMYHADGTGRHKVGTYEIAIHNDDTDVISNVDRLAEILFHTSTSYYKDKREKHGASTYITGKLLACMDNVLSHGALNKKIPDAIWLSPVSVINSYIKGMTLDSTVVRRKNGAVSFEMTVMDAVDSRLIQMHLASQGILCSIQNKYTPETGTHFQRLKFGPEAYDMFKEIIGFVESRKFIDCSYPNRKNRTRRKRIDNSFFVAVKKIEYGTNDVYDLHIPGTHSFISNGMISHNTGRMSSAEPNMQNIPSKANDIRHMFRATPGYVLLSSDYSQQEPKLTAYVSQDENMIRSFKENKDIYSFIASIAFNKTYEECKEFTPDGEYNPEGKARRTEAKSVVLGILYGRSTVTIADQLYSHEPWSDEKKVKQAQYVYDSVLNAFPALRQLMIRSQQFAKKHGYVETILGRRRHIPDMMLPDFEFAPMPGYVNPDVDPLDVSTLSGSNEIPERIQKQLYKELTSYKYFGQVAKRIKELAENEHIKVINNRYKISEATRQVVNSIIQGSAADLTKLAMLKVENDPEWNRLGGRILVPVHDELIAEVPIENWKEGGECLSRLMCEAANFLPFSIKCDVTTTYRWYGLEYPCPYKQPESIQGLTDESEINWVLYHLFEIGYELPVYKGPNGEKPEGDAALGISGIMSETAQSHIQDYCNRYSITEEDFISHIHTKVHTASAPLKNYQ